MQHLRERRFSMVAALTPYLSRANVPSAHIGLFLQRCIIDDDRRAVHYECVTKAQDHKTLRKYVARQVLQCNA